MLPMYQGYPLPVTPPGVNIRTDYSPTFNYAIPLMQTDCWPVRFTWQGQGHPWQQVLITSRQNTYWSQQQGTMRAWLSLDPNGINILPISSFRTRDIHLGDLGNNWCFYDVYEPPLQIQPAQIQFGISPNARGDGDIPGYWFNIQNLDGKENAYYLRMDYFGYGGQTTQ